MTDSFDFTALASRPPSRFKVLAADGERFAVMHRSTRRAYEIRLEGPEFVLRVYSLMIRPEDAEIVMRSINLRNVLIGLGYLNSGIE